MAPEALEEKKPQDGAPIGEKEDAREVETNKNEVERREEKGEEEGEKDEGEGHVESPKTGDFAGDEVAKEEDEEQNEAEGKKNEKGKRARKQRNLKVEEESSGKKRKKESTKKEAVTPIERPSRERKSVDRYSESLLGKASSSKALSIEKGTGTQLKDIPNVAFKLSKRKPDDNLKILHMILFGKKTKAHNLKKNISQFSGFVWVENEEKQRAKVKEKLDKCFKEKLVDFCDLLNIPISKTASKKEEISAKLLEFLESPHVTTDVLLADKEPKGKRKRSAAPSKRTNPNEPTSLLSSKKRKQTSKDAEKEKLGQSTSTLKGEEVEVDEKGDPLEDESNRDADSEMNDKSDTEEDKSEEEDKQNKPVSGRKGSRKKNVEKSSGAKALKNVEEASEAKEKLTSNKRSTSAKSTKVVSSSSSKKGASKDVQSSGSPSKSKVSSKKQKAEKESQKGLTVSAKSTKESSAKNTTKESSKSPSKTKVPGKSKASKKAKPEPKREEMYAVAADIMKGVDFNTATLSDILKQLGTHFGLDLMHRKAEVKEIITEVINDMSDDEEEEEEEEEGDERDKPDAGKDGD